jgi:signal transduction histidine kinase
MFRSARLKLTAWYLLIIMLVSISFSLVIHRQVTAELRQRFAVMESRVRGRMDMEPLPPGSPPPGPELFASDLASAERQLLLVLLYANAVILVVSAGAGYVLAGRTLRPIEEALAEQKRFIADASHELRTPLTALKASNEVALRDKKLTARAAREVLAGNLADVDRLTVMADRLLALERYQARAEPGAFETISAADVVDEAIERVRPMAEGRAVRIESAVADGAFDADRAAIVELLVILLDNGVKYTDAGGRVRIEAKQTPKRQSFVVSDTGAGIESSHLPHIFDRFYRGDVSRNETATRGHGLGLSLAKEIADAHKGSIEVSSTPGEGSVFAVTLPRGRR